MTGVDEAAQWGASLLTEGASITWSEILSHLYPITIQPTWILQRPLNNVEGAKIEGRLLASIPIVFCSGAAVGSEYMSLV